MMTISEMAKDCGVPRHRVLWVLASRRIDPVARIGTAKVYSEASLERVRFALLETAARTGRAAG